MNKRLSAIKSTYNTAQASLVAKAVDCTASYLPVIEAAASLLAELDLLCGFASAAANAPREYCRPIMSPMGEVRSVHMDRTGILVFLSFTAAFIQHDVVAG
jgi:DNA mismatch repair ATPase MutS